MSTTDDIKVALLKVAANLPMSKDKGVIPLQLLIDRGIVQRQSDMQPVYNDCGEAAKFANAEALSLPAAISIIFDFAPANAGGGLFRFRRLRSNGY